MQEAEYFRHNRQISSLENLRGVGRGDNYYPVREDAGRQYEREEKGNCLGAALSLLREDLPNEREYQQPQAKQ
ncbi:MAG: hypothetical protein LBG69_00385 [Zoogloeaceae bacterium]|jgi:hypothetical protein|nr:hypothetical protein [Zoogloeaceae bacterium]